MATGLWEDFTSKWGFNDGESCDKHDWQVRDKLCEKLNGCQSAKDAGVRFLPYDRPGVHNACQILVVKDMAGKTNAEMEKAINKTEDAELPESMPDLVEMVSGSDDPADVQHNICHLINELYEMSYDGDLSTA